MNRPGTPTWAGRLSGSLPCWRSSISFWSARQSLWVEHKPHRKLTINTCGLLKTWFITAAMQSRTSASVTKCGLDLLLKKNKDNTMSAVFIEMKRRASCLCLSWQGNISRQEAVSMIPPLLMKIESHHKVKALLKRLSVLYAFCVYFFSSHVLPCKTFPPWLGKISVFQRKILFWSVHLHAIRCRSWTCVQLQGQRQPSWLRCSMLTWMCHSQVRRTGLIPGTEVKNSATSPSSLNPSCSAWQKPSYKVVKVFVMLDVDHCVGHILEFTHVLWPNILDT